MINNCFLKSVFEWFFSIEMVEHQLLFILSYVKFGGSLPVRLVTCFKSPPCGDWTQSLMLISLTRQHLGEVYSFIKSSKDLHQFQRSTFVSNPQNEKASRAKHSTLCSVLRAVVPSILLFYEGSSSLESSTTVRERISVCSWIRNNLNSVFCHYFWT